MLYLRSTSWYLSGDGGNDVSMIQAADCGIGIEGKVGLCFCLTRSRALSSLPHRGSVLTAPPWHAGIQ